MVESPGLTTHAFGTAAECLDTFDGHRIACWVLDVHLPGMAGGGVTVLYGNSEAAIPKATNVPMYDRSLVIFKDPVPPLRRDFERRDIVRVES